MGNRATILFFDRTSVSPTVYLHWHGDAVPAWLERLSTLMRGRYDDASYAAARFVGLCHENIDGNLSLSISSNGFSVWDACSRPCMENASPGNAGMVVVDTSDFSWRAYGGYLANIHTSTTSNQEETNAK
jgi:hypothetical protein